MIKVKEFEMLLVHLEKFMKKIPQVSNSEFTKQQFLDVLQQS